MTVRLDQDDLRFWRTLDAAAAGPGVHDALRGLYARVDAEVAERNPVCRASGDCCRFDSYGHRLYVTGLEIAWFLRHTPPPVPPATADEQGSDGASLPLPQLGGGPGPRTALPDACVYQISGLCTARETRPLGCRVYFCEPGTEAWQQDLYERHLAALRDLHDRLGLPYRYMEWRAGLIEARGAISGAAPEVRSGGG